MGILLSDNEEHLFFFIAYFYGAFGRIVAFRTREKSRMKRVRLPFFVWRVPCGFPSPADDYVESTLDLDALLIAHPEATFYVRVSGDSMKRAAIFDGDILVVDRAVEASHNAIVLAVVNGEFTVKRLHMDGHALSLVPEHPAYQPIPITNEMEFQVWGVVIYCIHKVR